MSLAADRIRSQRRAAKLEKEKQEVAEEEQRTNKLEEEEQEIERLENERQKEFENMSLKELRDMPVHSIRCGISHSVMRVPGGWIYSGNLDIYISEKDGVQFGKD